MLHGNPGQKGDVGAVSKIEGKIRCRVEQEVTGSSNLYLQITQCQSTIYGLLTGSTFVALVVWFSVKGKSQMQAAKKCMWIKILVKLSLLFPL